MMSVVFEQTVCGC